MKAFIIIIWIISAAAVCQDSVESPPKPRADYCFKVGINFSTVRVDTDLKETRKDVMLGVCAVMEVFNGLYLQPEVMYSRKGVNFSNSARAIDLTYLDLALLAKVYLVRERTFNPFLYAGPGPSFLMTADSDYGGSSFDIIDYLNKMDFNAIGGIGIGIKSGDDMFVIDARYTYGFVSIYDGDPEQYFSDAVNEDKIRLSTITLSVGYQF